MIGSPALRDSMDSIGRSLRPGLAPALSPAAISAASPATATYAGRSRVCLRFGFTQRDVMCVPSDRADASLYLDRFSTYRHAPAAANPRLRKDFRTSDPHP